MGKAASYNADLVLEIEVANKTMLYYAFSDPALVQAAQERGREPDTDAPYDDQGAMYFAVAVILIYGISIALLIGSTMRKRDHDEYDVKKFLRSFAKLDRQEKRRVKQNTRMTLIERNLLPIFPGCALTAAPGIIIRSIDRSMDKVFMTPETSCVEELCTDHPTENYGSETNPIYVDTDNLGSETNPIFLESDNFISETNPLFTDINDSDTYNENASYIGIYATSSMNSFESSVFRSESNYQIKPHEYVV